MFKELFEEKLFEEDINEGISSLKSDLKKIVKKYQKHIAGVDSIKTGSGNSTARATRSGMIEYMEGYTSHGYAFNTHVYWGIKVGGNVNFKIHTKIEKEVDDVVKKYWSKITIDSADIMFHSKSGTNFSVYGVREGGQIENRQDEYKSGIK